MTGQSITESSTYCRQLSCEEQPLGRFQALGSRRARRYLLAPDYQEVACQVIRAMHEQVGELRVNEDGLAVRGLLVRHLVMPGLLRDTRAIMHRITELSPDTYVNVMDQYYPAWKAKADEK